MKNRLLFTAFFGINFFIQAQIGIGTTTPDISSILDITSTDKGILVPRINLIDLTNLTTPINAPVTGLLIWNTNATVIGGNGIGFYFFNGAQWSPITQTQANDTDWYEEGTTTAPNDINDNMFTMGNVAIGKNTTAWPFDLEASAGGRGVSILMNGSANVTTYGLLSEVTNTSDATQVGLFGGILGAGNGEHRGVHTLLNGAGAGIHYGIFNEIQGTGSGYQYGIRNNISNSSDAWHAGVHNEMTGIGSGQHTGNFSVFREGTGNLTGTWTQFSENVGNGNLIGRYTTYFAGGDGIFAGGYTSIGNTALGNGIHYGTYYSNNSPGNGTHFGSYNVLTGSGSGVQYGINNIISNTSDSWHWGIRNLLSGTGDGQHTGVYNKFTEGTNNLTGTWNEFGDNVGDGNQIGTFNNYLAGGDGVLAGMYTQIQTSVTGNGSQYGSYITLKSPGNGIQYGNYSSLEGSGNGIHYGTYNSLIGIGTGEKYGIYNSIDGTGSGRKYATYNYINPAAGGVHYGLFVNVQKPNSFAGYFLGNVAVDTNTLYVDAANNRVGIGTNTPATTAHIVQTTTALATAGLRLQHNTNGNEWTFYTANSNNLWFVYNGVLASFIQPNGTYIASDQRLKSNINSMESVMDKVMKLNPVTYHYNSDKNKSTTIGFLAQEVEPLFPESTQFEAEYGYYGLKYDDFGVIAIKAIQEQQTQIDQLKTQLLAQQKEIEDIKAVLKKH